MTDALTQLGAGPTGATTAAELEAFRCSRSVDEIELRSEELICRCPVTGQPDIYDLSITYVPSREWPKALETKSVKTWLWSFQQRVDGVFAEDLAAEIAADVFASAADPVWVSVRLVQNVRGGIVTTVTATEGVHP